ncbi:MAG: butyrate kinase [Bacillota bacterium]
MPDTAEESYGVLAINPGNTSTKVGMIRVMGGEKTPAVEVLKESTLIHGDEELSRFEGIPDQMDYRLGAVEDFLADYSGEISAVVGRGGLLRPIPGGTYATNEVMLEDLRRGYGGHHASNLGGLLASAVARRRGVPSFVVDPVSVDEMDPVARISGLPQIDRISQWHALNCRAAARRAAHNLGKQPDQVNLVVVHMGSGITVVAMERGRAVDVNNAVAEGPFGSDRAGGLPATGLVDLAFSGEYDHAQLRRILMGGAGLYAYLGTTDTRVVEEMVAAGDERASLVFEAMVYQIGKEIGAMAASLRGEIDAIVLTGGMARSDRIVDSVVGRIGWIAPVTVFPGEDELRSLALGAYRVLSGRERPRRYPDAGREWS